MQTLSAVPSGTAALIRQVLGEFIRAGKHFTSVHLTNEVKRRGGAGSHSAMQTELVSLYPTEFVGYVQVQLKLIDPTGAEVRCQGYFPDHCTAADYGVLEQAGWVATLPPVGAGTALGTGAAQPVAAPAKPKARVAAPKPAAPPAPKALPGAGQTGLGGHILNGLLD